MEKYVIKFMPEYYTTSLWSVNQKALEHFNTPIEYTDIDLSVKLIKRLEVFDDNIMNIIDWSNPAGETPMKLEERELLYQEGLVLIDEIRKELGEEFEVINYLNWIKP